MKFDMNIIFGDRYLVNVPAMATYDNMELDVIGTPMNVKKNGRMSHQHEDITTAALTIFEMADVAERGMSVTLVDNSNLEYIYFALERMFNFIDAPQGTSVHSRVNLSVDKINTLDNFAQGIYRLNNKTLNRNLNKYVENDFKGDLGSLNLMTLHDASTSSQLIERSKRSKKPITSFKGLL